MKIVNFEDYKFRCSDLGKLMVNPRKKTDTLSATTRNFLHEKHAETIFGKSKEIQSKYLSKGIQVEEDAIEMLNTITGKKYAKNEDMFHNDMITGTPDINGDSLIDIKSSWDFSTFPMHEEKLSNRDYYWQMHGYMELTGHKESTVAYCLVDTPKNLIEDEIRRVKWQLGFIDDLPVDLEQEIYNRHQYNDLPEELRIKTFKVDYNQDDISALYERIEACREYLTDLSVGLGERIIKPLI